LGPGGPPPPPPPPTPNPPIPNPQFLKNINKFKILNI